MAAVSPGWQHGLGFDPAPEFLMQSFDDIGGAQGTPLALREAREGEQALAGFLQAVGHRTMFDPPLADEGLAARFDLGRRSCIEHVVESR